MSKKYLTTLATLAFAFLTLIIYAIFKITQNPTLLNLQSKNAQSTSEVSMSNQPADGMQTVTLPATAELEKKGIANKKLTIPQGFALAVYASTFGTFGVSFFAVERL